MKNNNKKPVKKTKKEGFFKQIRKELKLVKWPTFKEVAKYTIATIVLCLIFCGFFILLNLLMSWIKGMFI